MQDALTILVADDQEPARYARARVLRGAGFATLEACSGAEAIRLALERKPDLVLVNVDMPCVDGLEVCRRLKAEPGFDAPVVQISATYSDQEAAARGLENGADACLADPAAPVLLVATVQAALRSRSPERRARQTLDALLEHIPQGITIGDAPDGRIRLMSREGCEITGLPREALTGACVQELQARLPIFLADGVTPAEEFPLGRATRTGEAVRHQEMVLVRPDGRRITLLVNAGPIRGKDGRITGGVAGWADVTGLKAAQEELRKQAKLIEASGDAIIMCDGEGRILRWNEGAREMYDWSESEALGRTVHILLGTEFPGPREQIEDAIRRDGRWEGELVHTRRDGTRITVESRHSLVDGTGFLEINRDVTARKEAERALYESRAKARESEERLRLATEAAEVGVWHYYPDQDRLVLSTQCKVIFGLEPDDRELDCRTFLEFVHPEDRERTEAAVKCALERLSDFDAEYRIVRPNGAVRWVAARGEAGRDENGLVRFFGAAIDITDRKRNEEVLRNTQKVESVGSLAAGVAHEFNNLLTSIIGHTMLTMEQHPAAAERLEEVVRAGERAAELTRQLLAYAGKAKRETRPVDISQLISDMEDLLYASLPDKKVHLQFGLAPALPPVDGDPNQLQQMIVALVTNAAEAVVDGAGAVFVSTGVQTLDRDWIAGHCPGQKLAPGNSVYFEVTDTGSGMDERTRSRIFDPFFTTKFLGRGLGLAAAAGIVRAHKGAVWVDSAPGRGSTFRVFLPAAGGSPAKARHQLSSQGAGDGSILIVDDERSIRHLAKHVLESLGYPVLLAADGQEALATFDLHRDSIRLVVLDITMPVMGGVETLAALKRRKPELSVVLTSGYNEEHADFPAARDDATLFLPKPFTSRELASTVRSALGD